MFEIYLTTHSFYPSSMLTDNKCYKHIFIVSKPNSSRHLKCLWVYYSYYSLLKIIFIWPFYFDKYYFEIDRLFFQIEAWTDSSVTRIACFTVYKEFQTTFLLKNLHSKLPFTKLLSPSICYWVVLYICLSKYFLCFNACFYALRMFFLFLWFSTAIIFDTRTFSTFCRWPKTTRTHYFIFLCFVQIVILMLFYLFFSSKYRNKFA